MAMTIHEQNQGFLAVVVGIIAVIVLVVVLI